MWADLRRQPAICKIFCRNKVFFFAFIALAGLFAKQAMSNLIPRRAVRHSRGAPAVQHGRGLARRRLKLGGAAVGQDDAGNLFGDWVC